MDIIELLLALGLTTRLVRFAVVDDAGRIVRKPAYAIGGAIAGARGRAFFEDMFDCPYCVGAWISLAVAGSWAAWASTTAWQIVALAGTMSWLAGYLSSRYDDPRLIDY